MHLRRHPLFQFSWCLLNALLVASAVLLVYGIGWEISTERYLKGFADSVVPLRSEERRVGKECRSRWSPYH